MNKVARSAYRIGSDSDVSPINDATAVTGVARRWRTTAAAAEANTPRTAALILGDEAVAHLEHLRIAARLLASAGRRQTTRVWEAA